MKTKTTDKYKYLSWSAQTHMEVIMAELENLADKWKIISHSQNMYGMSVILERIKWKQ
jgi:hypothetical protein